ETLEQNAEQGDDNRRYDNGRSEAEISRDGNRNIGAEGVKRAVREIDDTADTEDQGQTERDEQVVAAEHQAIHHLLDEERELHSCSEATQKFVSRIRDFVPRFVVSGRGLKPANPE